MAVSSDAKHLLVESWTLYAVTILVFSARIMSRRLLLGSWKKLQIDDYLMMCVILFFTVVIVGLNTTARNLSSYLPPGVYETLSPAEVANAVYGSKWVFVTEQFQLATLWLSKACLLILYSSMTIGLPKQHRIVKYVGIYTAIGYIITNILFLAVWCRPIQQYWQVPVDNSQCASYYHHIIAASTFNISSDILMLLIPIPLLIKARLPRRRKAVLCAVFSLGVFCILAAILNRYYNFTSPYGSLIYLNWYAGEGATAVMVANIPHCWPVISRIFRLGSFQASSGHGANSGYNSGSRSYVLSSSKTPATASSRRRPFDEHGYIRSESEERIANAGTGPGFIHTPGSDTNGGIGIARGMDDDVELGNVKHQRGAPSQDPPYVGTAVTAGGKSDSGWAGNESGTIVKTVSMNQTFSDQDSQSPDRKMF